MSEEKDIKDYIDEHIKEIHTRSHNFADRIEGKISELEKEFKLWKTEEYVEQENSKRISELEKMYGRCFSVGAGERHRLRIEKIEKSIKFMATTQNVDVCKKELAELKEQVKENQKWLKTGRSIALCNVKNDYAWKHINLNREVLRELINILNEDGILLSDNKDNLLSKLGGDSKLIDFDTKKANKIIDEIFKKGGEKSVVQSSSVILAGIPEHSDSKPPEEDPDDIAYYYNPKNFIQVSREDLEKVFKRLEHFLDVNRRGAFPYPSVYMDWDNDLFNDKEKYLGAEKQ